MKKIYLSIFTILTVAVATVGATLAAFSDQETSTGNTFTAGTLDLTVDGSNENVIKFNVTNMKPGSQRLGTWRLANAGSTNGTLNLPEISVNSNENSCIEPEVEAGDTSCEMDQGELADVLGLALFIDQNCNGWYGDEDTYIFNGTAKNILASYDLNYPLNAGSNVCVSAIVNWWHTPIDNLAQGDDMTLDMSFLLEQL